MSDYYILSGAVGWVHPGWLGGFYPEGLPEDWQLSFYNTQFRCVYLTQEQWRNATDEEVARWLQDTRDEFRFVLGAPGEAGKEDAIQAGRFGARGVPEHRADICWLAGDADFRRLAQRMQNSAHSGVPLYVISRDGELARLRQVGELMQVLGL